MIDKFFGLLLELLQIGTSGEFFCHEKPQAFEPEPRDRALAMDERDHLLANRAWRAGMVCFWLVFVTACMGAWAFLRYGRGVDSVTLPPEFFPMMAVAGFVIATVTQAVVTLHYYGWGAGDASAE